NDPCVVEQQLAWAHAFGIDFFVFDWYHDPTSNAAGEQLNSAFDITRSVANRHGMQYAILYTNGSPFEVSAADWPTVIDQWAGYFADTDYVKVNGLPLFIVINPGSMRATFGSSAGVATALGQLRAAARAHGLAGVYAVGGLVFADGSLGDSFPDLEALQSD